MKINIIMPFPGGRVLTSEESAELAGQWVTVLAFGEAVMAQVQYADPISMDGIVGLSLEAVIGQPAEDPLPEPTFLSDGQEITQDLGLADFDGDRRYRHADGTPDDEA